MAKSLVAKMPPIAPPPTIALHNPNNIADDIYNAFSIRMAEMANFRPVWSINLTVDQVAFYIGAVGGVTIGYLLNQYEPPNIDNIDYEEQQGDQGLIKRLLSDSLYHPFQIVQRFFIGGGVYVLIGMATSRMLTRPTPRTIACGALTGCYFSNGAPFSSMLKSTASFAVYAIVMESLWSLAVKIT